MQQFEARPTCRSAGAFLALLLLYVAGLLGQGLHLALSQHQVCEHGELQHAEPVHVLADAAHDGVERAQGPQLAPAGEAPQAEHHHCSIALANPVAELGLLARPVLATRAHVRAEAPPRAEPRLPSIAIYRLAPHHSPPLS